MLELKNITKVYAEKSLTPVNALKGVSLCFNEAEFVSVLGPSGCGKTTMLNIIGGLDRYTEGDLIIDGVSTKDYTDRDWDAYRNHSVGFVFQSYNLIPHQSVVQNVELALTLSGIDKQTRRKRAEEALELVGLKDQMDKRPNQLSGGQMQRVAIARAIVNDPEIILADEPTGALDSQTSVQVMEILKNLSKDRLVIMVTHNAELAEQYSTRIVTLSDGLVVDDKVKTEIIDENATPEKKEKREKQTAKKSKKPSMSLFTAFSLSLNNLFTKLGRTILTSFAGSIGIIGIALILSLSTGFNGYIENVQRDTLSNYPISITKNNIDLSSLMTMFVGVDGQSGEQFPEEQTVISQDVIENMLNVDLSENDLSAFKEYLDDYADSPYISAIKYNYGLGLKLYSNDGEKTRQLYPVELPPVTNFATEKTDLISGYYNSFANVMNSQGVMSEMIDNDALINSQYDVLAGHMPVTADEVLLVVDTYNQIDDMTLYMLGLMNESDIAYVLQKLIIKFVGNGKNMTEEELDAQIQQNLAALGYEQTCRSRKVYTFEELLDMTFKITVPSDTFVTSGRQKTIDGVDYPLWEQLSGEDTLSMIKENDAPITENGYKVKISGIVRLKEDVSAGALTSTLCYTKSLTDLLVSKTNETEVVKQHVAVKNLNSTKWYSVIDRGEDDPYFGLLQTADEYDKVSSSLGMVDLKNPSSISIYPTSFEAKDKIVEIIDEYNAKMEATGDKNKKIKYNDYIGLMMSSIADIINSVTYVLIAFVSISLIVSSIMISVITHISVLERTKEIGVLRSIGASKRDISRVFNAETAIIGTTAGVLGIVITLLLNIPISIIIQNLSGLANMAVMPPLGAIALIAISIALTVIAGLIPASKAAKQDPVVALRTE